MKGIYTLNKIDSRKQGMKKHRELENCFPRKATNLSGKQDLFQSLYKNTKAFTTSLASEINLTGKNHAMLLHKLGGATLFSLSFVIIIN